VLRKRIVKKNVWFQKNQTLHGESSMLEKMFEKIINLVVPLLVVPLLVVVQVAIAGLSGAQSYF
jgi:lipopolysaccharide/colanic/teichoic acid biosynthesis glycosyltransferase